ncbi:ABC transporter substrate-binding protein [Paenibacillus sp. GCM10027628]|uniref:ABC transporter substrate-binding protein n=1 Tax=Paenibacillus sp. GCM10027628 TaxID=3273413 RepID=UPI003633E13C
MTKRAWKNTSLFVLATLVAGTSLVGCSASNEAASTASPTKAVSADAPKKEKSEVNFWYLWNGKEAENVEKLIAEFNASQDKYTVKGLSVPDVQKIIVALSSGSGPDITDNFSSNTASYAEKGISEPLDEYIKKDNFDTSDFVPGALQSGQYKGKTYALPINVNFNLMFYNKKLFAEAGLTAPPKTDKELLEYSIKLTKVNADKTISVLGFPDFPLIYYVNPMSFALGGSFIAPDGKLTPDNPGTLAAIQLMKSYRDKFGVDNITKFNSSAKYLDATDPFISGKQAIRFDGPWFGNTVKNGLKIEGLDYGIAPLPAPEGKPEMAGGGEISASTFFIAKNSKNKEGGWAFISWLLSKQGMTKFNSMFGNLPARTSVYDDPTLQSIPDFKIFADAAKNKNLKAFPAVPVQTEYTKLIGDQFELAVNGKKSPEEALKEASDKANSLK